MGGKVKHKVRLTSVTRYHRKIVDFLFIVYLLTLLMVLLTLYRNEYQEHFLGVKAAGA